MDMENTVSAFALIFAAAPIALILLFIEVIHISNHVQTHWIFAMMMIESNVTAKMSKDKKVAYYFAYSHFKSVFTQILAPDRKSEKQGQRRFVFLLWGALTFFG